MKFNVPFYYSSPTPKNPMGIHCVENSLQMILGYFEPDKKFTLRHMEEITAKQPEKATWEMQWSIWFVNNGYQVKHYSLFDYESFKNSGIEYIRKAFGEETAQWQLDNSDVDEAVQLTDIYLKAVDVIRKHPTIEDIKHAMEQGYLVKVGVNQCLLNRMDGYVGHSVVVTAIDEYYIWINDPGLPAFKNKQISHKLFKDAMDIFGGEIDAIKKKI